MNCLYKRNKISVITAEFNELSSEIYRNGIPHSELKILPKIQLGVICAHMVDFCRPGHIKITLATFLILATQVAAISITHVTNT